MFDPQAMNRFIRMLPGLSGHHQRTHRSPMGEAAGACGRCPACGEFVLLEQLDEVAGTACPSCGLPVHHLIPLGDRT